MTPKFRNPGIHDNSCILKSSFQNFTPLIGISPKSACSHRWKTPFHNIFDFLKKSCKGTCRRSGYRRCQLDRTNHPAGISYRHNVVRNILGHHRTGADGHIVTDCDARQNGHAAADPDIIPYRHRLGPLPS